MSTDAVAVVVGTVEGAGHWWLNTGAGYVIFAAKAGKESRQDIEDLNEGLRIHTESRSAMLWWPEGPLAKRWWEAEA